MYHLKSLCTETNILGQCEDFDTQGNFKQVQSSK